MKDYKTPAQPDGDADLVSGLFLTPRQFSASARWTTENVIGPGVYAVGEKRYFPLNGKASPTI